MRRETAPTTTRCGARAGWPVAVLVLWVIASAFPALAGLDEAYRLYRKAETRVERREFEEALTLLDRALEQHADSGVFQVGIQTRHYFPYYLRGLARLRLGDSVAALEDLNRELESGQIQQVAPAYTRLLGTIDEAKALDTVRPEVRVTNVDVVEFDVVERDGHEVEQVVLQVEGYARDADSGIRTISIAGVEAALTANEDRFEFRERVRVDATDPKVEVVVRDAADNVGTHEESIDLPSLDLGEDARRIHAVIVGVNEYDKRDRTDSGDCTDVVRNSCDTDEEFACYHLADLSYSVNDARQVAELLKRRGVPPENITLLLTGEGHREASLANVREAIRRLKTADGDKLIFFFSGHGMLSSGEDNRLLLADTRTWECRTQEEDEASGFERTTLGVAEVARELKGSRALERYIVLDACRSPLIATKSGSADSDSPGFSVKGVEGLKAALDEMPEDSGPDPIIFYSTLEEKVSVEWNAKASGYFTWFLLQGLRLDLPLDELKRYVQAEVKRQTREDLCSPDLPASECAYLQAPYLQLPKELEQDYDLQSRTYVLRSR